MKSIILSLLLSVLSLTAQHAQYMYAGELRFASAPAIDLPVGINGAWSNINNSMNTGLTNTSVTVAGENCLLVVGFVYYQNGAVQPTNVSWNGQNLTLVSQINWYNTTGSNLVYMGVVTPGTGDLRVALNGESYETALAAVLYTNAAAVQNGAIAASTCIGGSAYYGCTNVLTISSTNNSVFSSMAFEVDNELWEYAPLTIVQAVGYGASSKSSAKALTKQSVFLSSTNYVLNPSRWSALVSVEVIAK